MKTLLRQAKVIFPNSDCDGRTIDLLLENGKILKIDNSITAADNTKTIEDTYIAPALVDGWCFSGEPGFEYRDDFESLKKAAKAGGYGYVHILPSTRPSLDNRSMVDMALRSNTKQGVKIRPYAALSLGACSEELTEIIDISQLGVKDFTDGVYAGHSEEFVMRSYEYLNAIDGRLSACVNELSNLEQGHINQSKISTSLGLAGQSKWDEIINVRKMIDLARYTQGKLHIVNISCKESVEIISEEKNKGGVDIVASVPALNLLKTDNELGNFDENLKVNPPLRSELDRIALIEGIKAGVIDFINSNHAPYSAEEKEIEFPYAAFGSIGLQTTFALLKDNQELTTSEIIYALSIRPRAIFGIPTPIWEEGKEADIVIWKDEPWQYTLDNNASKSRNSPFFNTILSTKIVIP